MGFTRHNEQWNSSPARWGILTRSLSIHWATVILALVGILTTIVYTIAASKGYTTELAIPGFSRETQVGLQKFEDEYLAELSRYLVDQFQRELEGITKKMHETIEVNRQLYSEENIRKLAKDELSRQEVKHSGVDYASVFSGCRISEHTTTHAFGSETYKLLSLPLFKYNREPELILHRISENLVPGFCWPFKGESGYVTLQLQEPVKINEVVYAHVDKNEEPINLIKSAPHFVEVWGGIEPNMLKYFGEAEFTREQSTVSVVLQQPRVAKYIKFIVTENYGADFTCLYRLHVYANSTSVK